MAGGVACLALVVAALVFHPVRQAVSPSWANAYSTPREMSNASDSLVLVRFDSVREVGVQQEMNVIFTDYQATVQRVISGRDLGADIVVHQLGGAKDIRLTVVEDDPPFEVGQRAILFVKEYKPGHVFVVGGPTGRLDVSSDDRVSRPIGSILQQSDGRLAEIATRLQEATR